MACLLYKKTAYSRLKSNPTPKELDKLFSPSLKELNWTKAHSRNPSSQLNFLIFAKNFSVFKLFCSDYRCSPCHYQAYC